MHPWEIAIQKLKALIKKNKTPEDWADNLIKSSSDLKEKKDWALFYRFLSDPKGFDPTIEVPTLGDLEKIPDIQPYEDGMEVSYYQNGPLETTIHVKNKAWYNDVEDEKVPE